MALKVLRESGAATVMLDWTETKETDIKDIVTSLFEKQTQKKKSYGKFNDRPQTTLIWSFEAKASVKFTILISLFITLFCETHLLPSVFSFSELAVCSN